jgi:hypothetical protein
MSQLSGHLWNAALLLVSATVALAADRTAASESRTTSAVLDGGGSADIAEFMVPLRPDAVVPPFRMNVPVDPFGRQPAAEEFAVAPGTGTPTVSASSAGRRLTAILIADERRVAVIDDAAVGVGDVLRDGARVASIQTDRVFVVDKSGRWRTLTLTNRGGSQ